MKVHIDSLQPGQKVDVSLILAQSSVGKLKNAVAILTQYLENSDSVWVGYAGDDVACLCGIFAPTILSNEAYLWMLHTNIVDEHQFLFVRHSQLWMEKLLESYPTINGHMIIDQPKTTRWLKWLGAEFSQPEGLRVPFVIRAKHG